MSAPPPQGPPGRESPRAARPASGRGAGSPAPGGSPGGRPAEGWPGGRSPTAQHTGYPPAYRPQLGAPAPSGWGTAGYAPPANTTGPIEQLWTPGQRTSNRLVFNVVIYVVGGIALLLALGYIALGTGLSSTSVAFVLALVPLTIVLLGVRWLDRWEPEPKTILLVALLWGAGVAVLSALVLNSAFQLWIFSRTGDQHGTMQTTAIVVAPIVEELVKGLGVLVIYLFRRQQFDGPVDGVVYAATVAAGFAFTENILYFSQNADFVAEVFVMRGIFSPFAHALFTSCIGIAVGLAARSARGGVIVLAFPAGLVGAMGLHALWNGSALIGNNFLLLYALIQVPLFLAMVALLIWLRRQESKVIRARLTEYAQAGWFAPHEVDMLASMRLRSQAKLWASGYGERAKATMVSFQRNATMLAFRRQQVLSRRLRQTVSEEELLHAVQRDRHAFAGTTLGR